ncbi:hypothetical protein CYY_004707 [Polysphondylium violaceum]|uniref:F-box domain-containing protein n=1 Tax=Polysphondylium violaceum TaxID=133409 RepID=A0A8J4PVJ3_9MYCE|nr:hypothetical protein CYY_004707 [Polysphondylium violaceum]
MSLANFVVTFRNRIIIGAVASIFLAFGLFKALKGNKSNSNNDNDTKQSNDSSKSNNNSSTTATNQPTSIVANKPLRITSQGINKTENNNQLIDFDLIQLPHHILFQIFQLISPSQFLRCTQVSKKWKSTMLNKLDKAWIYYSKSHWNFTTIPETDSYFEFFKITFIEEKKRLGFAPEKYIITIMEQSAEFTDPSRWASERIFQNSDWWKLRFLEEMNSTLKQTRLVVNNKKNSNNNILNSNNSNNNNNNNSLITKSNSFDNEESSSSSSSSESHIILGNIYFTSSNSPIGTFRFIDKMDAQTKFRNQKWLAKAYIGEESPYTGDVVGYFNFTLFGLDCPEEVFSKYKPSIAEFLKTLTYQTRGTLTRLDSGYTVQSVLFEDCKLSAVFGKYGMNDGDALLDTDNNSAYIASLIETIQKFLDKKGVGYNSIEDGAKVNYTGQTSHNPIRYSGHLGKEALQWEIGLWIYNTVILNNKKLWGRRLEDD